MTKKIFFSDKYGLTDAVLQGRKTMTRRIAYGGEIKDMDTMELATGSLALCEGCMIVAKSKYKLGEVLAVAQAYKDLGYTKEWVKQHISPNPNANWDDPFEKKYPGWDNKMFVPAELNKAHQIRITDIKIERLHDITDEDCQREGILALFSGYSYKYTGKYGFGYYGFSHIKDAFASLINGVSGKGTWERNPWVFAYSFKLVK